jgi:hypothetical protein
MSAGNEAHRKLVEERAARQGALAHFYNPTLTLTLTLTRTRTRTRARTRTRTLTPNNNNNKGDLATMCAFIDPSLPAARRKFWERALEQESSELGLGLGRPQP